MIQSVREIVFDTETTGFDPATGDKLVEIGAVELINHVPTGRTYHQYINPEREVPEEVVKVHGLTTEYLKDFPIFAKVAQDFIDFVGEDGILVAHNATFDMKFINYELQRLGYAGYGWDRVVDTLEIAKNKFPGQRNNLDVCVNVLVLTIQRELFTALCLMPSCWQKCILSCWAVPNRRWNLIQNRKQNGKRPVSERN